MRIRHDWTNNHPNLYNMKYKMNCNLHRLAKERGAHKSTREALLGRHKCYVYSTHTRYTLHARSPEVLLSSGAAD